MNILTRAFVVFLFLISSEGIAETITYYVNDISGSPIAALDEKGRLLWRESYMPFGQSRINPSANYRGIGLAGHEKDDESQLLYMQARYYDPVVGRFYSIDPQDFSPDEPRSLNRYAYAANNPYRYIDPDGRWFETLWDAAMVVMDVYKVVKGYITGDQQTVQEGLTDLAVDTASLLMPGLPAGITRIDEVGEGAVRAAKAASQTVAKLEKKGAQEASGTATKAAGGTSRKVTKGASKEITKSSRKRVKRLIKSLSDNSRQNNGLSQEKTDQLRRIVEKAGGKLRNDGASGVKGSSAGKPHVQTEGLGKGIDSRHIWTKRGVQ